MRQILFDRGTLILEGFSDEEVPENFSFDHRIRRPRAQAYHYRSLLLHLQSDGLQAEDQARHYGRHVFTASDELQPRPYQAQALEAWCDADKRGLVVLPTGAGKSRVARLCIVEAARSTLVVAPTLDLVALWYDQLKRVVGFPIGVLGGGVHDVQDITVATYDSAYLHMDRYGGRFGLVIFDEVHHLPSPSYAMAAESMIAPFRLGLTATLERSDGLHEELDELVGPVVFRKEITELAGDFLAPYRTETISVSLGGEERQAYEQARGLYRKFISEQKIRLGGPEGWNRFLRIAARSSQGREAFKGWRESRRILQETPAKIHVLEELLRTHPLGRVIIFTNDNATVYRISKTLLIPAITHQTDVKERRAILAAFEAGKLRAVITSRVLNEGVDLPAADVGVVLSGTNTVREHVQRLGRILRKQKGKQAVLYELVVAGSSEERTSTRRRDHVAYRDSELL